MDMVLSDPVKGKWLMERNTSAGISGRVILKLGLLTPSLVCRMSGVLQDSLKCKLPPPHLKPPSWQIFKEPTLQQSVFLTLLLKHLRPQSTALGQ